MTPKALIWTIVAVALAIAIPLGAYAAGGSGAQSDDTATSSPATKTLTDNGDGTYDLAINVTGKSSSTSEQLVKPVDIVLVLDVSGSMDENITSYSYSPISGSPSTWNTYYVQASDGSYVSVKWEDGWFSSGTWRDRYGNTYDPSTTQFYSRSKSTTSKLNALKSAVDGFLDATAKTNANITDENSKIRVSIVKFAGKKSNQVGNDTYTESDGWNSYTYNYSQIVNDLTSGMSTLKSSVNALTAGGATSADYGMKLASTELGKARSDANTCVIFFTDGEPNHSNGFEDTVANGAISTSQTLKSSGTTVYSIGVLSGADPSADPTSRNTSKANKYLQAMSSNYPNATGYTSLGGGEYTSGYYKAASSSEELSSIFDDIFSNISSTTTISNVSLTDNLTSMTATSLVNGEAGNFTYTKTENGNTTKLTGFPPASYQNGTITWNLGNTVLENGVTYTVHAKVWPSQTALDLVADLNNGTKSYDSLTDAEKAQLKQNSDGTYTLYTNPDSGNTVTYTEVTTKTSSHQPSGTVNSDGTVTGDDGYTYTKNADSTWTGTKADTASTTSNITNPTNGMAVSNQQVSFKKVWEGDTPKQTSLTAELQKDGSDYVPVTVTSDKNWTTTTNVAMGIIDKYGTVLGTGHDYTVTEPSDTDYHFEYSGETYRPMLINNVPTVLVKIAGQEDGAYQIDGSWYKPAAATGIITATNVRKSTLNLSKTVVDNSANSDAPADALFTFTAKVTDSKASDGNVWFSIQDASGNTVKDADRVSGATAETGDTGYYYAASGSEITLKLKAGDNVRFINVSTGATYSFAETAMDNGFSFTSAAATVDNETASASEGTVADKTVSGTVTQANKTYRVAFTDTYDATAPTNFTATKAVSGFNWNKSADIQVSATGDKAGYVKIPTSASTQTVSNIKNAESQQVTFTGVEFLAEGTYTLNVKETTAADSTSDKGWTYDNSDHAITVRVAKGKDGKLAVTKVEGDNPTITNAYKADSVTVNTSTDEFFSKRVGTGNNNGSYTFNFTVEPQNGAPSPEKTTASVTYDANQAGKKAVDFGSITFDAAGTYNYKVTETTPSDGWTTPNAKATVTVTVSDDGSGQLTAAVAGSSITNNYGTDNVTVNTAAEGSAFLIKNFDVQSGTPADKKFDFTLTKCDAQGNVADGATPLSGSVTYTKGQAETSAVVDFGTLTFTQEGTYYYKAQETTENGDGWTKSSDEPIVKIVVTNDGEGHLVAEVSGTGTITNTYKADHIEVDTKDTSTGAFLTKAYNVHSGLTPNDAKFDFSIAEVDADGNPVEDGYTNTGSADYTKGQTETTAVVDLGQISYTTEGTHYYKVSETSADSNGWTKAENSDFTVKVTVTDNGKGQLVATVSGTGSIANAYSVTPVVSDPPVTKVVEGNPSKDATFSFTLTPDNPAYPMPTGTENGVKTTSITGSSSSEFGEISFTAPGTYTYTVAEVQGNAGGYTYDTNTHSIKYTVTDNGDGTLSVVRSIDGVEGAADSAVSFTNMYKDAPTTVDTDAEGSAFLTKAYDVADGLMPANKDFSFSITEVDADGNAVEGGYTNTGSADYAAGETSEAVDLGTITYDEPGTHYYKVTEATPDGGWTKSGDGYVVTVTVTDNGDGTLKAAVSGNGTITNTYKTTSTQLDASTGFAQKNVTSPNPTKDATFSFTLAGKDGAPMPANADGSDASSASVSYEAGESGTKNIDFGSITYTEPGTYSYTVTESTPASGWTATTSSANVNVTVKDNGDGTMSASVDTPATITNSYQAAATDSVTIKATKSLTGAPLMAGEFSFTLTGNNGAPMPSQTKAANVGDGSITFGPITYTEAGTYTYTVAEVYDGKSGFTYDTESKTVTVTVTDDGAGQLVAKVSGAPVFANSYVAESGKPLTLTAKKVLEGRALKEDQFSFQLFDESGNAVGEPVANDASGSITFPELNYTQQDFEGNGVEAGDNGTRTKTVTYTAKEVVPDEKAAGYTYSDNVAKYTVKLVDDGAGNITATLESSDSTTFTNTYKASPVTAEAFKATKELTGRTINAGEFKFQLTDEAGNVVEPVSNAADGTVTFSPITYKLSDLNNAESKTFKYTISEVGNDLGGVTYDTAKHTVSVTVTDNGDGTLTASKPVYDGNSETAPTFTNTYQAAPEVVPLPTVTKTVAGDQTDTYPTFSFVIEAQDGAPSLDNADGSSVTKTLDGPGSVDFGSVTFSAAGKYTYKIYEVAGDSDGWTYDGNVYTLTYTVTDNGNGRFDAVPTITNSNGETVDAVSFENTYTKPVVPEPAKPAPKVPDTGDTTSTALPVGLACIAVVAIAAGFIIKRKSNGSK